MKIKCACGCGKKLSYKDKYGRPRVFINGHNRKGVYSGKYIPCYICKKSLYRIPYKLKRSKYFVCKKCFKHIVHLWSSGKNNYHWKGFFYSGKNNKYIGLRKHNHPMADKQNRILEHRFVMSQKIGRILEKKEIVHHKNGNSLDNRPKNLILCKNNSEHIKKYHHKQPYRHYKRLATAIPLPS